MGRRYNNNNGGRGGRQGRGGRGGRDNRRRSSQQSQQLMKFTPHSAGKQQTATYETVKDAIEQFVQKTYDEGRDIAESLRAMQKKDLSSEKPTRRVSRLSDEKQAKTEQDGFDIEYNADYIRHGKRETTLDNNFPKAYSLIFTNYCTRAMQTRIEEHPDFESSIRNNPIALLEAIKTLMHDPVRARYPWASMTESLARFLNMKQHENEQLLDYVKRFKQDRDVLKSHVGKHIFDNFIENTEEYRNANGDTEKKQLKDEAFEQWCGYLLLRNSDGAKYGTVTKNLVSQFSMGTDQYPKTVTAATDVLSNHRFDNYKDKRNRNNRGQTSQQRNSNNNEEQTTSEPPPRETSFAQTNNDPLCYCCGSPEHTAHHCPKRNSTAPKDWYARKAMAHMQEGQESDGEAADDDDDDDQSVQSTRSTRSNRSRSRSSRRSGDGWCGLQLQLQLQQTNEDEPYYHLKDLIILDNGSTAHTMMNPDMVENIRPSQQILKMKTNAGTKNMTLQADVRELGTVWYDANQIANIFGFASLKDTYRITYDSDKEDAFLVHLPDKIIKFERTPEGLYAFKPPKRFIEKNRERKGYSNESETDDTQIVVSNLVSTLAENRKRYTHREFLRAKEARALYYNCGFPTVETYKHALRSKIIQNCKVTIEDVNIAEDIFGPDMSAIKAKWTRTKPKPVKNDTIEIPTELIAQHHNLRLCIDIMYINNIPMMTGVDTTIPFRSLVCVNSMTADEFYKAIDEIFRHYNGAGFLIGQIDCDRQFKPLMNKVKDELSVHMNYTATDDHVPEAERNNRTIEERVRATYHRLPYAIVPIIMIKYMAMLCTKQLNYFPQRGGVSKYFSPHMIMSQRDLDYERDLKVPFGAYVQACHEPNPTNTNAPRAIDAIYLMPLDNAQGGHEDMDLNSGRVVTRRKVTPLPVTPSVIKAVEAMAAKQGMKSLKFKNRHGVIFIHCLDDWIGPFC